MKLINGILRPGEILEVLENGKIKASAPGLFSEEDLENLPPIMPFWELMGSHANTFSTPTKGDECWILNLTDNPLQLYWFRKDPHIEHNKDIFEEGGTENVEIICNRESGVGYAALYFSDGSGWVLRNDDSCLQIFPDGHIELGMSWPHRAIKIDSKAIHLGVKFGDEDAQGTHPACFGDVTAEILMKICGALNAAGQAGMTSPYTMTMAQKLVNVTKEIQDMIPCVTSTHVKLD